MRRVILLGAMALCACEGTRGTPANRSPEFARIVLTTGDSPGGVAVADLNGDGRPDLIVTNESGSVSVFLNSGRRTFRAAPGSPFAAGQEPNDVAVADFNGDRHPDLAFANHDAHVLTVLLGDGSGGFPPAPAVPVRSVPHPHGIAAADFDRDGRADILIDDWGHDQLELLRGDGRGRFSEWLMVAVGRHPYQRPRAADLNRDGWPDLLTSNLDSNDLSILLGGPRGFSAAPGSPFPAGDGPFGVATGDFNGDGRLDAVVINAPTSAMMSGKDGLTLLLGDGSGRFALAAQPTPDTGGVPNLVATGDLDGDGRDDVVASCPDDNSIVIFYMGADARVVRRESVQVGKGAKGVAIADLDGDGRNDIAVTLQGAAQLVLLFSP